jgi:hypothetical protein
VPHSAQRIWLKVKALLDLIGMLVAQIGQTASDIVHAFEIPFFGPIGSLFCWPASLAI